MFGRAARHAIYDCGDLSSLGLISEPLQEPQGGSWPSWIPRYDYVPERADGPAPLDPFFHASGPKAQAWLPDIGSDSPRMLEVTGLLVDEAVKVIPGISLDVSLNAVQDSVAEIERLEYTSPPFPTHMPKGGTETIIGLVLQGGVIRQARATHRQARYGYRCFKRYLQKHQIFPPSENTLEVTATEAERAAARYDDGLNSAALNRAVFYTKHGRIGLGPRHTEPGDRLSLQYCTALAFLPS